jgi:hypothetical protein
MIEIQTSSFASIRRKMRTLSQHYRVTLVYPAFWGRFFERGHEAHVFALTHIPVTPAA